MGFKIEANVCEGRIRGSKDIHQARPSLGQSIPAASISHRLWFKPIPSEGAAGFAEPYREQELSDPNDGGVFSPKGFKPYITNWEAYARQLIQRLHRESRCETDSNNTIERIQKHSELPRDWWALDITFAATPAFPIEMEINGKRLSFFTLVAAVAMPTDTLAQDLRVETMFPANAESEAYLASGAQV